MLNGWAMLALAVSWLPRPASDGSDTARRPIVKNCVPVYPVLARKMGVSGEVVLAVTIAPDGTVSRSTVAAGHPLLVPAAREAAECERYGKASTASTQAITFVFHLPGDGS